MNPPITRDLIRRLPKTDLHLHLDGSIRLPTLIDLAKDAGVDLPSWTEGGLGDTVFRLGRDPLRKLAPDDRLVAPARLAEKAGIEPKALALAIAAALRFAPPEDPIAMELQNRIQQEGLTGVLESASGIRAVEPLGRLVQQAHANF